MTLPPLPPRDVAAEHGYNLDANTVGINGAKVRVEAVIWPYWEHDPGPGCACAPHWTALAAPLNHPTGIIRRRRGRGFREEGTMTNPEPHDPQHAHRLDVASGYALSECAYQHCTKRLTHKSESLWWCTAECMRAWTEQHVQVTRPSDVYNSPGPGNVFTVDIVAVEHRTIPTANPLHRRHSV